MAIRVQEVPEWRQQYEGLSEPLKAVIQPLSQAYKEDYVLASDEEGIRMATEIYMEAPENFFDMAARHAASISDEEYMANIHYSLDAAQRMAIDFVVNDDLRGIRDQLDPFRAAAAYQAYVLKRTYEDCTDSETFLSEFKELAPEFVVRGSYLIQIYTQIPGDKAWFLAEHGDKRKGFAYRMADVAELYLKDRAKFELQYDIVYAYAQSVARARQTCQQWREIFTVL